MAFKLRPSEFKIIVFTAFCSLVFCLFAAIYFNLARHEIDNLNYNTNSTSYNKMVNGIQSLNYSTLSYSEYVAQTNSIFTTYFNSQQKDYNDFTNSKNIASYHLYSASRAEAYSLNGYLAIPVFYMFFTASSIFGKDFRAKRMNIMYYRYYWFGTGLFFGGLALLGGSLYEYGRQETQYGVSMFIAGELMIIVGCYILREKTPDKLPDGYVPSDEEAGNNNGNNLNQNQVYGEGPGQQYPQYGSRQGEVSSSAPYQS
jgi:hypothetical protein